jgi:hypothetical protein
MERTHLHLFIGFRGNTNNMNLANLYDFFVTAIPHMSIMVASEGRFKSPAIDFDHENPSIGGDLNRPSDIKTNAQILFCLYAELLFFHYNTRKTL